MDTGGISGHGEAKLPSNISFTILSVISLLELDFFDSWVHTFGSKSCQNQTKYIDKNANIFCMSATTLFNFSSISQWADDD